MQKRKLPVSLMFNPVSEDFFRINTSENGLLKSSPYRNFFSLSGYIFIIIFSLAFIGNCFAQSSFIKPVKKGLEYEYNFKWQQAEEVFLNLIKKNPEDPRGYHYQAGIYLWRYLSNLDKYDYNNFIAYSDTAILKGELLMETEHNNSSVLYTIGADYSYRALAFTKAEKFLDAVWSSKKSESYLRKTLEVDSTYYDAYLGLGLYNFAVGQIPAAFKWALNLAGIKGNVDLGMSYIKKAADKGNLSRVEAKFYMSQILSDFLFEYDKASVYLNSLVQKYPNNLLFNYSDAVLCIKRRDLKRAAEILSNIISADDTTFKQITAFSNFLMGDVLFKQNNFSSAVEYYRNFIATSPDNDYLGIAYLRLGICYEVEGDSADAVEAFNSTKKGNRDIEDDIFAERMGEIYAQQHLRLHEIDLIKYANLIDNGNYNAAYDSLSGLLEELNGDSLKAEVNLNLSKAAFYLGHYKESINFALTAKQLDNYGKNWIKPYSCYYAARADKKLGNIQEFNKFIDEAESYTDYDYRKNLHNMLYALKYND